ncbi:hypothetical protein TNCV_1525131 [Trichonephila clavipes]|nr:hypothetical protein TNCV_1525131 [Trichonephila clavipes]
MPRKYQTAFSRVMMDHKKKIELNQLERTPPNHSWYFGRSPGGTFRLMPRKYQTAFSRVMISHKKDLTFCQGQKIFPGGHWCYTELVSPARILTCFDFKKDEIFLDPLLFLEFLELLGTMDII